MCYSVKASNDILITVSHIFFCINPSNLHGKFPISRRSVWVHCPFSPSQSFKERISPI